MTNDTIPKKSQLNSQRYGNKKPVNEVFERETYPTPEELCDALTDTARLTEKEAFAFVFGHFEGFPHVEDKLDVADEIVQGQGFKNISEFNSIQDAAGEKVAEAIWICELIDAYRFPDLPEKCTECSGPLGRWWAEPEGESSPICRECADIDGDPMEQR